jgi:hypothetical protein
MVGGRSPRVWGYGSSRTTAVDKLMRALRAEIDAAAWSCLHRTVSRHFVRPASGKIAVKVIKSCGKRRPVLRTVTTARDVCSDRHGLF